MSFSVLSISYAKRVLDPQSRERARLRQYATALDQYHVIVFTKKREGYPDQQQDENLRLYATNAKTKLGMVWRAYKIGRQILRTADKTQLVLSSQDPFESSLVARLIRCGTGVPHQVQIHGDVFNPRSYTESLLQQLRVWYGRHVVLHAARVRVVSERIRRSVIMLGVPEEKVTVLPIQADLAKFLSHGAQRDFLDHEVTPLELLYVGRLAPEKNASLLLHAAAQLQARDISFHLRIVGDGPERATLQQLTQELQIDSNVTFVGWTDDITGEMSRSVILCLSSNHEGWGMVLQEAAAMCLPIVTTDVGCAGELIINEQTGLVVPVGDATAFAAALERLQATALRKKLAQAAHQRVKDTVLTEAEYLDAWVAAHFSSR